MLQPSATAEFDDFAAPLIGLPVSHVWQGHGSALSLEFGTLRPTTKRDGSPGEPMGEMSLMVPWSWRIEGRRLVLCGSWSEEKKWPRAFGLVQGARVTKVALFGHLPEIELGLSNEVRVLSFMTAEGDPQWTLFDRFGVGTRWVCVRQGILHFELSSRLRE